MQEEHRGQSRSRSQGESRVNTDPSLPALPTMPGQGSQSDSESLLMLPQQSSGNQINPADTSLLQHRHGAVADVDIPGPSGLQAIRASQSAASSNPHANEASTDTQSQTGVVSDTPRPLVSDGNRPVPDADLGQSSTNDAVQRSDDSDTLRPTTNRMPEANDMHGALTNQDEDDEPMETVTEDENSNDSMSDFQEPKKPAVGACDTGNDDSASDDESVSVFINVIYFNP